MTRRALLCEGTIDRLIQLALDAHVSLRVHTDFDGEAQIVIGGVGRFAEPADAEKALKDLARVV